MNYASGQNPNPQQAVATASSPGGMTKSDYKLKMLRPDIYGIKGTIEHLLSKLNVGCSERDMIEAQLARGDVQPAIVISMRPLLVSAYSDEFDGVVILDVPAALKDVYNFQLGTRLVSCCFYGHDSKIQGDISPGPKYLNRWQVFNPVLADICSGDYNRIRQVRAGISEDSWHKAWYMGLAYRKIRPGWARFGLPGLTMIEAIPPASAKDAARSVYERV